MLVNLRNPRQRSDIVTAEGRPESGASAVVVDPSPLWAELTGRALARIGVSVVATPRDARDALATVAEHEPDVLVIEIDREGSPVNGIELVRRACEAAPRSKVIVLSSVADEPVIEGALAAGAAAYIVKTAASARLGMAFGQAVHHSLSLATRP